MQILAGNLKGRKIETPDQIRPVSQRVKKSCFDILSTEVKGLLVLDLFAGSGSLGIEALSRGAKKTFFIDHNRKNIKLLEKNLVKLGLRPKASFYCQDSFSAIRHFYLRKVFFNLIFLDPPYNQGLLTKSLQQLVSYDILARSGYLAGFCYRKEDYLKHYQGFSLVLERRYGQTIFLLYRKESNAESSLSGDF